MMQFLSLRSFVDATDELAAGEQRQSAQSAAEGLPGLAAGTAAGRANRKWGGSSKPTKTAAVGKLALRTGARITGLPASVALTYLDESIDPRMEVFLTDDPPNPYYELMYGTPSPWGPFPVT